MPDLTRRTLLAGAAATGALAATAVRAQDDKLIPAPDLTGKAILSAVSNMKLAKPAIAANRSAPSQVWPGGKAL